MTKEELQALAAECFEANKGLKHAWQTSDGVCFKIESDAINHRHGNKLEEPVKIFPEGVEEEVAEPEAAAEPAAAGAGEEDVETHKKKK